MKTKQILIVTLCFILTVCMSIPSNADILSSSKVTATIDKQLQAVLQEVASTEKIPVDIWLYETSTHQEREQAIFSKIGLNKAVITAAKSSVSAKEVDEYIATERSLYAEEMAEQYAVFKQEYANIEGLQDTRKADTRLFYSQYAPMISAELTRAEIKTLAYDSRVESIDYSPNLLVQSDGDISVPLIDADYTRDTLGYSGSGIRIGMIEVEGFPNKNMSYFTANKLIYDSSLDPMETSNHATYVAAIMIAQSKTVNGVTYKGIVPDATLYATYSDSLDGMRARIEWLLSQGVHVINMSAGSLGTDSNTYGTYERWWDHIAIEHSVHFVKSAGNTNGNINRPGMAYNVLTVGAIDDNNTINNPNDDTRYYLVRNGIAEGSSYIEADGLTNKPDLVAPGENITTASFNGSGTSGATPHVTAVIAQLCQRQPSLRTLQAGMKAILTASITHETLAFDSSVNHTINYDQFGAGVVNAKAAFDTANSYRMSVGNFNENSVAGEEKVRTFTAVAGQHVRVSLTWLMHTVWPVGIPHDIGSPSFTGLSDLHLTIIGPGGSTFGFANNTCNNTEIVDFVASQSGTYQIVVTNYSPSGYETDYAVSWWLE